MPRIDFSAMITAEARQDALAAAAEAEARRVASLYLAQTDWLVVRHAETGRPVPGEVSARRAEARATLNR